MWYCYVELCSYVVVGGLLSLLQIAYLEYDGKKKTEMGHRSNIVSKLISLSIIMGVALTRSELIWHKKGSHISMLISQYEKCEHFVTQVGCVVVYSRCPMCQYVVSCSTGPHCFLTLPPFPHGEMFSAISGRVYDMKCSKVCKRVMVKCSNWVACSILWGNESVFGL